MVNELFAYVERESTGMDAVYEDYIIELIGKFGLLLLRECKLLEPCGVIGGRQLYTLVK